MYYNDHSPPHFHAKYGSSEVTIRIDDGTAHGKFPRRALSLVMEWHSLHKSELLENWELARARKPLRRIEPLE